MFSDLDVLIRFFLMTFLFALGAAGIASLLTWIAILIDEWHRDKETDDARDE